tara:strand:- start:988 stop:2187 length:1200 start_codon:yes stop_codon:yes gene_type:complete
MHQRIEKPRIYTSMPYYDYVNGFQTNDMNFNNNALKLYSGGSAQDAQLNMLKCIDMNPYEPTKFLTKFEQDPFVLIYRSGIPFSDHEKFVINYFAILGHNFYDANAMFMVEACDETGQTSESIPCDTLLNCHTYYDGNCYWNIPMKNFYDPGNDTAWQEVIDSQNQYSNGTSIININGQPSDDIAKYIKITIAPKPNTGGVYDEGAMFQDDIEIGNFMWGKYHDLKSPDLNYTMGFEYDGIVVNESKESGKRFVNKYFDRNPGFLYKYQPFGVNKHIPEKSYNGRRYFNLQFTALADSYTTAYDNTDDAFALPEHLLHPDHMIMSNDFYTQVIRRTMGGTAPFIFETHRAELTDSTTMGQLGEHDENNFIFAAFDQNDFTFDHTYHRMYSFGFKIRECW